MGQPPTLLYDRPAYHWLETIPLGNGALGATVGGHPYHEQIGLNLDRLWAGGETDRCNPRAATHLPLLREALFAHRHSDARRLADQHGLGEPLTIESYQPLGSLWLEIGWRGPVSDYRRWLNLQDGVATTMYRTGEHQWKQEAFVSWPDQVLAIRLTTADPRGMDLRLRLTREKGAVTTADGSTLVLTGTTEAGLRFEAAVRVRAETAVQTLGSELRTTGAPAVTILLAGRTIEVATDSEPSPLLRLDRAAAKDYPQLLQAHQDDHQATMDRVQFSLAGDDRSHLPLLDRLADLRADKSDPGLLVAAFQHRRYLLLAASRPGTLPSNLQGIWNDQFSAPWNSDYHPNINLQMNYWAGERTNMAECVRPLIDWLETAIPSGSRTAKEHYGCRGWTMHHVSDRWHTTTPCDGVWGLWPMGGAWLAQHVWWHYEYSGDREFLQSRGWPIIRGAAMFLLDFLVEAPLNSAAAGKLVTCPSHSPENSFCIDGERVFLSYGVTMDLAIVREVLGVAVRCCEILDTEKQLAHDMRVALVRLPPYQISPGTGALMEWIEDYQEEDPGHRHLSHLFGLYPGTTISPAQTPQLAAACRESLLRRMSHWHDVEHDTGWTLGWAGCLWARLGDGDKALECLTRCLAHRSMPNLMTDAHHCAQVGDTHGLTATVCEMLLQDHEGILRPLPALPSAWPTGSISGLRGRGGLLVDLAWKRGRLCHLALRATQAASVTIGVDPTLMNWSQTPLREATGLTTFELAAGQVLDAVSPS